MSIIARFVTQPITTRERSHNPEVGETPDTKYYQEDLEFSAIADTEGSNKNWAHWTPCGNLKMTVDNPPAQGHFKPGDLVEVIVRKIEE